MVVDIQTGKTVQEMSFFTKEPLGFAGSMNFYLYADGDSVNFVDVSGLNPYSAYKNIKDLVDDIVRYVSLKYLDSSQYEYLAEIYFDGVAYYYTEPYTSYSFNRVYFQTPLNLLKDRKMVAFWHNHVCHSQYNGSLSPSNDDYILADYFGEGYMTYFESSEESFVTMNIYPTIKF